MRIEAYTQVQQLYQTQKTNKPQATAKKSFSDQLSISSVGKDIQTAKTAMKNVPDIRPEVVEPLKEQIKNGSYEVDVNSFADKLFAKYEEMR